MGSFAKQSSNTTSQLHMLWCFALIFVVHGTMSDLPLKRMGMTSASIRYNSEKIRFLKAVKMFLKDLEELINEDQMMDLQKYSDIVRRSKESYNLHRV